MSDEMDTTYRHCVETGEAEPGPVMARLAAAERERDGLAQCETCGDLRTLDGVTECSSCVERKILAAKLKTAKRERDEARAHGAPLREAWKKHRHVSALMHLRSDLTDREVDALDAANEADRALDAAPADAERERDALRDLVPLVERLLEIEDTGKNYIGPFAEALAAVRAAREA